MEALKKHLLSFKKLHIDRAHGIAPHKPILLLSVLQAFRNNLIADQRIFLTPELVALFRLNWSQLVVTKHDCRISYPFYYLKSDKFWKLVPNSGFENINQLGSAMKKLSSLNAAIDHAIIDDELYLLMKDEHSNLILQQFLLDNYFPETKSMFAIQGDSLPTLFTQIEDKIRHEDAAEYTLEIQKLMEEKDEEEIFLRGSIFKREIPKIYNYTCCISGMRVDTSDPVNLIDACHIIPFSESYNDTITNGISLCPNLHRAFDRGLITIDLEYKVRVSASFNEARSLYSLRAFDGMKILLPSERRNYPSRENLEWHRINRFWDNN